MAPFTKLLSSVLIALLYTSATTAMPSPSSLKHSTHRTRSIGSRGELKLETFHPESTFEGYGVDGLDHPLARRGGFDIKTASVSFLASKLGISQDGVKFRTSAEAQTAQHAFLQQQINGVPVANAVANVAFNSNGKVVSFSSSFVKTSNNADKIPTVSLADAISTAEQALGGTYNGHPATLEFLVQPDDSAALTHVIQIQNEKEGKWFEAFVDAHSNKLLSVTDFVTKASYLVLPINEEVLTQGFQTLTDPQDLTASPDGWHSDGTTSTTTTAGNNVIAFKGSTTGVTSQSSSGLNFIYTQNAGVAPTTATNVAAAVTNAFYIVNSVHDFSYKYGFTEATFNFQNNNFGKGGRGNDRVTVSVQDSAGVDNADFSTPPDGQSGAMRMFLWDITNPERDGAIENDIVIHENTHGITNRMTGGGTGRCLQTTEAGGMGEGWSDTMADWNAQGATTVDFVLGQYVINNPAGIRTHPYSTSATTNPLRYSNLQTLTEVHAIGEVWANMLHNVYASLVTAHGWSATARTNPNTTEGNVVFMHLFLDSLLLQPCNPTFLTARNAWIQADANRFAGANNCLLWHAFASRGLGVNAANHVDDSTVPAGC
ncbi:Fungalysin metallopeptidase-domain-containing protein [Multifurca ochricompacta]|uniref:Extracellular metalloproteinase n=1 Tax=Multifurca ochricompacta TaxID=376703 RepID=A0AAD4M656_9AGAM|nr:Fungalysin metallopeptidase-domain-containing protein [Multifurca ochricompacta]